MVVPQLDSSSTEERRVSQDLDVEKRGNAQYTDEKGDSSTTDVGNIDSRGVASKDESEQQDAPLQEKTIDNQGEVVQTKDEELKRSETANSGPPYSSFGPWEKKFIVFSATMAAFFSPFTAQIYFPALNTIANDLHVSSAKINLTMTTYMASTAPAFVGGFSDNAGRRPAYIVCFVIYIAADVALALQNNYVALLILRMLQSAGSSGTVALANAVVADIATSAERGIYIGITSLTGILAPSLGPVLGGILSQYAGWKWIFGFLAILATTFFIPMLLFFPETCRKIVGDGTIPPPKLNHSVMSIMKERKRTKSGFPPDYAKRDELAKGRRIRFPNPLATLVVVAEKEAFLILFFAGIVYSGFYAVISGMPSQFQAIYGYSDLKVGLMYLPLSGGSLLAAFTQGKLIDWNYQRHARKLGIKVVKSRQQDLSNFPIEKARLQIALPMLFLSFVCIVTYGWVLHFQTSIAGPCILLLLLGYSLIASTQTVSILIVDINPGIAGTATAALNLVRCLLGAGATALIVPMTNRLGLGWSYTLIGFIYIALTPMLLVVMRWGPKWRKERVAKEKRRKELKEEKEAAKSDGTDKV
ncbi:hypothetical protein B7463_g2992, partial [Scytalidium lignicola]